MEIWTGDLTFLFEAREVFRQLNDIPNQEIGIACDYLEDRGWLEQPINMDDMANLVPLSPRITKILVERGFPHVITRKVASGGARQINAAPSFRRGLLVDLCNMLHISVAQHVDVNYAPTPLDLMLMVPLTEVQRIASKVYEQNSNLFAVAITGRRRAPRARFVRPWVHSPFERTIVVATNGYNLSSARAVVLPLYGVLAVLRAIADWVEEKYHVRPDVFKMVEQV